MEYTVGKWTISSMTTDTVSTTKNMAVPDLSYTADYSVSKDTTDEAILVNTTGSALTSPESIRFGRSKINNVYEGSDIPGLLRHPIKSGTRTLCEVRSTLSCVNSVSGVEYELPIKGWVCLQLPTVNLITENAVAYMLTRAVAATLNTGKTDASRELEIFRGDLTPNS